MMDKLKYSQLEIAKILGEPKDPRKPYTNLVELICETDTANPEDYVYVFDVLQDTDKVYVITSTGEVTQENVSPDTPATLSFADIASPEYYIKITDLAKAKEKTLARKVETINRALNAYENYKVISLIDASIQSDKSFSLASGEDHFNYEHLVNMISAIEDYADDYVLVCGSTIRKDIRLWDWKDNKYTSLAEALKELNVEIKKINQTVTIDDASTSVLAATKAYLVGRNSEVGRPVLFVRKKLDTISMLGGVISEDGDAPERLIFASPNPVTVVGSSKRYLAVGVTGYEEIAGAVVNPYALSYFSRS